MEALEPQHKRLVIKMQPHILKGRKTIYHSVRWAWRINADRASKADFVLGCVNDICEGVFVADKWMHAAPRNFPHFSDPDNRPDFPHHRPDRFGFDGHEADYDIQKLYVGKLLPDSQRGGQTRVRYINC